MSTALRGVYLDYAMTEWQGSNILQIDIATTQLFAADEVIISASEDSLKLP